MLDDRHDHDDDSEEDVFICVRGEHEEARMRETRVGPMKFHIVKVQRPLASAAKIVKAGELYRHGPRRNIQFKNGSSGTITLDSGAGVNVWPEGLLTDVPMLDREPGLRVTGAERD